MHPLEDQDDASDYVVFNCLFGYFFVVAWMMHTIVSKNMKLLKSLIITIRDHIDLVISAVFVGYLFVICEFIATTVYLRDLYSFEFHLCLWVPSLVGFISIFFKIMHVCYKKCKKQSQTQSDALKFNSVLQFSL